MSDNFLNNYYNVPFDDLLIIYFGCLNSHFIIIWKDLLNPSISGRIQNSGPKVRTSPFIFPLLPLLPPTKDLSSTSTSLPPPLSILPSLPPTKHILKYLERKNTLLHLKDGVLDNPIVNKAPKMPLF